MPLLYHLVFMVGPVSGYALSVTPSILILLDYHPSSQNPQWRSHGTPLGVTTKMGICCKIVVALVSIQHSKHTQNTNITTSLAS
jgi:hypothetical protein